MNRKYLWEYFYATIITNFLIESHTKSEIINQIYAKNHSINDTIDDLLCFFYKGDESQLQKFIVDVFTETYGDQYCSTILDSLAIPIK